MGRRCQGVGELAEKTMDLSILAELSPSLRRSPLRAVLAATLVWVLVSAALSLQKASAADIGTGAFTKVFVIDSELQRGVAKKTDVRRVLGTPKGFGDAVLPQVHRRREIWYYEDIELKDLKSGEGGVLQGNFRQQVLLVFFEGEVFDGYMWFTNVQELSKR